MSEPLVESVAAQSCPGLRALVTGYTGYRIEGAAPGVHRGLPSRHLTFIITVNGTVDLATMPDPRQAPASFGAMVGGLHSAPALIRHDGNQHGIQAALTPLGARTLLGMPASELATAVVDLATLLGTAAGELADRVRSAYTWTGRFLALDAVLARVARDRGEPDPEVGWAWERLHASHGAIGIGALAEEVGWSRRHLGERFRREYGLTPKVAARVMRFEVARELLRPPDRPPLAEVAARCGYYDQAHFTREWRDLAGCSPRTWFAEELPSVQDTDPLDLAS
ncbi:MAG TPA: helix-turn-helix domain-containing protein [Pseudonocardiaceae bacterium]|jgi:AraC-like DNA-binding protein|nr:helix-turn-helix domain-containing protein [Pseudonocardiaceae bacterium]